MFRRPPSHILPLLTDEYDKTSDDVNSSRDNSSFATDFMNTDDESVGDEPNGKRTQKQTRQKLLSLWEYLSLRGLFRLLGRQVGGQPYLFITISLFLSLSAFGMYWMVLKDRIRDGYTPTNAPSRYETDVMRQFWNASGDPMMAILMVMAKDGGSMHRKPQLDEAAKAIDFFFHNFSVNVDNEDVRFMDMCEPYCALNRVFNMFKDAYDEEYSKALKGEPLSPSTNLTYPLAIVNGLEIHLERCMFGVKEKKNETASDEWSIEDRITNMEYAKVVLMTFQGEKNTKKKEKTMNAWELGAYEYSLNQYTSELVEIMIIGTEILDHEMMKDARSMTPNFAIGYTLMILFVSFCVFITSLFFNQLDRGKIMIAVGTTLSPFFAIVASYGIMSTIGLRINSFMLVMPFLIMGIGVDDGFLMTHSWQRMSKHRYHIVDRMGMVYEEVGPSITITSLTNFLSFGIGAMTPTPEIRLFCLATAIATALNFFLELMFFGAILAVATRYEKVEDEEGKTHGGWRDTMKRGFEGVLHLYCRMIGNRYFALFALGIGCIYWYFCMLGIVQMKTRLDAPKILPRDSPIQKPNYVLTNIVWAEYHPVFILVNTPFNVSDINQIGRFFEMVDEFENMHHAKDSRSSLVWLRDYISFYHHGEPLNLMALLLEGRIEIEHFDTIDPIEANLTSDKLEPFLKSKFYEHWKSSIRLRNTSDELIVEQFWINIAYENTSTWDTRIELMEHWRDIVARYPDLNATVWEPNGMFVDQMLCLKGTAVQTGIMTLVVMMVVCAIFIPNPCSVITAGIAIASITIGVIGFMTYMGFDLDPVVMAALLMSIGMSVDFTAHVAYHYQLTSKKEIQDGKVVKIPVKGQHEKLMHTLHAVGWPMVQAGLSTILCISPLLATQSYSASVFVVAIFLVVSWGLLHGLIMLPAFLAFLPESVTNLNCYHTFLSSSSESSCRYIGHESINEESVPMQGDADL